MNSFRYPSGLTIFLFGMSSTLGAARAQPGDLFVPLPPDYCQVRNGLPATVGGTQGGAYCGPTATADLLKWMNVNGYPLVGMWGVTEAEITAAILSIGAPANMNTGADSGTTTENLVRGLQTMLDSGYPGQFDVGYIGRTSESAFEQDLGRDFAWIAFHLAFGHLVIANIGWYDFQTTSNDGQRCGGHYVAMTGYDDDGVDLYARFRDPARDINCAVLDATGCAGCGAGCGCVVRWKTSYDLVNLEDPDGGCVMEPVFASKWFYNRSGKTCATCCENCGERLPYQDGFVYAGGVNLFSRPDAGMFIVGYNMAAGTTSTSNSGGSSPATTVAVHPFQYEVYHAQPNDNQIYKANPQTGQVTVFTTTASLNQPRRLAFGSDGMLYVLQGNTSPGFNLLAIRRDGSLAGSANQSTMGAFAYHEKTKRIYWWSGPSNQLQAFTAALTPIGGPLTLPSGPAFVAPGYMAADPTGDVLYYNHDGSSAIFRLDTQTASPLPSISDTVLGDPADMVLDNRGHLYVVQETTGPILEFDSGGTRVTNSRAANLSGNTVLGITRSVRTPLRDRLEQNPHNWNVDSVDEVGQGAPDPISDPAGIDKSRFISFSVPGAATAAAGETALRVKLTTLHDVVPPYTAGASIAFTAFEGQSQYVGPPVQYVESVSSGTPFYASKLQCDPYYQDWSTVGLLHVTGEAIVPSSSYSVENLAAACLGQETTAPCLSGGANVSTPLAIATGRWGDVVEAYQVPTPPVSQPDFTDIGALVNKFKSAPGAPIKARAMLAGEDARGLINLTPDLGFGHISACVDAFKGLAYPYKPGKCTGAQTMACTTDTDCGANGPCILCP